MLVDGGGEFGAKSLVPLLTKRWAYLISTVKHFLNNFFRARNHAAHYSKQMGFDQTDWSSVNLKRAVCQQLEVKLSQEVSVAEIFLYAAMD